MLLVDCKEVACLYIRNSAAHESCIQMTRFSSNTCTCDAAAVLGHCWMMMIAPLCLRHCWRQQLQIGDDFQHRGLRIYLFQLQYKLVLSRNAVQIQRYISSWVLQDNVWRAERLWWPQKRYVAGPLLGSGSFPYWYAIDLLEFVFFTAFLTTLGNGIN